MFPRGRPQELKFCSFSNFCPFDLLVAVNQAENQSFNRVGFDFLGSKMSYDFTQVSTTSGRATPKLLLLLPDHLAQAGRRGLILRWHARLILPDRTFFGALFTSWGGGGDVTQRTLDGEKLRPIIILPPLRRRHTFSVALGRKAAILVA